MPADGAVRHANRRVHQPQIIVDLGDSYAGRSRAEAGGLLLDGDGRAQALDGVDFRPLHLIEKLPRVSGECLDIPPLALGVDRVKGERRLPRTAKPCNDGEAVARDLDVDVLEIVLSRAMHADPVEHYC